jgi:hypothetical protein
MTVYAVVCSNFSGDAWVEAVYSTRQAAAEHCDLLYLSGRNHPYALADTSLICAIEEYEVDDMARMKELR